MTFNMLSPMTDNNWIVKARVIKKTDKRNWKSAKGEGVLFGIDLLDCNGGEMNASFFNASAEKWYDIIQVGNTYIFSRGNLKMNNQKYR